MFEVKAKDLGINISAVVEMGIINYINEIESIGEKSSDISNSSFSTQGSNNNLRRGGDLNPRLLVKNQRFLLLSV